MQIAEKYRKELRELNESTLHLPTHAQDDTKEDADGLTTGPETPQLQKTLQVEVVKDANGVNEEENDEQSRVIAETSEGEPFLFFLRWAVTMFWKRR